MSKEMTKSQKKIISSNQTKKLEAKDQGKNHQTDG